MHWAFWLILCPTKEMHGNLPNQQSRGYFDRIMADKEELMTEIQKENADIVELVGEEKMEELIGPFFIRNGQVIGSADCRNASGLGIG